MGSGLSLRRGGAWQRCAQIAEARHGDDAETVVGQRFSNIQPLVIAAARAMDGQYRRTIAGNRIFNRAAGRLYDLAASRDALARLMNIVAITEVNQPE